MSKLDDVTYPCLAYFSWDDLEKTKIGTLPFIWSTFKIFSDYL